MAEHGARRGLTIVAALATLALLVAAAVVFAGLGSGEPPSRPRYAVKVTPIGADGAFEAVTANVGQRAGTPSCSVTAFDIHGQVVGSEVVELGRIPAGDRIGWDGTLEVVGSVERMSIDCG